MHVWPSPVWPARVWIARGHTTTPAVAAWTPLVAHARLAAHAQVQQCRSHGPLYHSALDASECDALGVLLARLDQIALRARDLGVRLMIECALHMHMHMPNAHAHAHA